MEAKAASSRELGRAVALARQERRLTQRQLAGYDDEPGRTGEWNAVESVLNECVHPTPPTQLDLGPLGPEQLFGHGQALERFDVAEAAITLLRVAAGVREASEPAAAP